MLEEDLRQRKNQLQFAISKINQLDNGINAWKRKFEHHQKLYNEQIVRFQKLKAKVEPLVKSLENKLNTLEERKQQLFICPHCLREYKQESNLKKHLISHAPSPPPEPEPIKETVIEQIKEFIEEVKETPIPSPILIEESPNTELEQAKFISKQLQQTRNQLQKDKNEINGVIQEIEWLETRHPEWAMDYANEEGGRAIWQGRITNGFRAWCENKGYKIGD